MSAASSKSRNAHLLLDGEPIGLDRFADVIAEKVVERLRRRGTLGASGIRSRRREEDAEWRDKKSDGHESTDRTPIGTSGESSWSMKKANEIIAILREKKMRSR
jgi:hypothetical protein